MRRIIFALILFSLALTSCAVDPRKEADAEKTRSEAAQAALNSEQARRFAEDRHALNLEDSQAATAERQAAQARLIRNAGIAGAVGLWFVTLALAVGLAWAFVGSGRAVAVRADVRARLIPLDPVTRQFPLLLQYTGRGKVALYNANTGSVAMLDTRREEHRQLIQASGAVQLAGAIAHEASRSRDPRGVAIIQPILTDICEVNHE